MKKTAKRLTAPALALVLCVGVMMVSASAATRSSMYLSSYTAWLTAKAGGKIAINVEVDATGNMDEVGAKKILLYESTDGGDSWKLIKTYLSSIFPEMYDTDTYFYDDTPFTYSGTVGNQYKAIVTVYAAKSYGSDSREYTTATVTAKR